MEKDSSIIIVDDNKDNLQVVSNILKSEGYKLALALDGPSALKILNDITVDLILLDIMMPGMNGFEVCQIIKNNPRLNQIPIIFLSALNNTEDIVKAFHAGAVDYITKPFQAEEVKARVSAHIQLQKQKNELVKLNSDKDKFISILAHDLKNPFHTLLGFCETLESNIEYYNKEKIRSHTAFIHASASKIYNLVESLLIWARSQSGKMVFEPIEMNIDNIFNSAIEEARIMAGNKNIKLIFEATNNIVFADHTMLLTILRNLISNAIKYSMFESTIVLNAEKKDKMVVISVSDNGIGLSSDDLEKLFKLSNLHSSPGTNKEKGSGLGLIICKEFVEKHGGTIWAESKEGEGSVFKFSIPEFKAL